jgi:hypothetical protein
MKNVEDPWFLIILSRLLGFEKRYGCAFRVGGSGALSLAVGTDANKFTLKLLLLWYGYDQFSTIYWRATSLNLSHDFEKSAGPENWNQVFQFFFLNIK